MEEKDEQILETADALREDIRRIEQERRRTFCKGIAFGALMTLALSLLVFFVIPMVQIKRAQNGLQQAQQQQQEAAGKDAKLLSPAVENKIEQLANTIDLLYYEDVDDEDLVQGLYKGLLEGVGDPYTAYYTPEEYKELMISATSSLSGIGVVMQQNPDTMQVTVNYVYEGSPAEKAGILAGDLIIQAEDAVASSMELSDFATHVRGDEGTIVHLKLYRIGTGYMNVEVKRAIIDVPTVKGEMLDDGIGYIMIAEFGSKTAEEFADAVKELEAQGMTSMIVDLRNNPGGMVDSVTQLLDQILPEGVIVWTEDKYGKKKEYTSDASCLDYQMAVLINESSASSSEIFAGAIRDYKYGTLIGTKTFGKGVVQGIRRLADGSAIKMTTSKYFTPNGQNIHGEGIEPDIKLEYKYLDPDATKYDKMNDNQILKAIEVLSK
ncbi:MAG: S41 family peptidase [Lachnospiraceae bacterium]